MTHAEVMKLLFEEQELEMEAQAVIAWVREFCRRIVSNLEEVQP